MAKISFTKKFKLVTFLLAIVMLLGAFAGCQKSPEADNHVVGDIINYVDGVYHEVYIEKGMRDNDKGLVVGLHSSAMKILTSADAIYDGDTEFTLVNGCLKTDDVDYSEPTLGSTNNQLKIVKGNKEYTLKYMYVTRAIRNVNDLSLNRDQFPSAPWENGRNDKYTPYIFEMPVAVANGARIPTLKIPGYFVLTTDIDLGGISYDSPGQSMPNTIKAGHAELRDPASNGYDVDVGFQGTFDGRGHTLSNFTSWQGGMFGYINGGTVKNLALKGACNYWQGQYKNIFADLSKDANFENIYVSLKQQRTDNGGVGPGQDSDGYGYAREYFACLFSRGTIHVKDCVLESFILDGQQQNNTNYIQFLNTSEGSTYENVHCVGSSPLAITSYNFDEGVKLMVTEKELEEFGVEYGETADYTNDNTAYKKFFYVMVAMKPLIENRNQSAQENICYLVQAPAGVEKYDTINKFKNAMKNDSTSVQAFMDTGCWNFDSTTGALTWKNI